MYDFFILKLILENKIRKNPELWGLKWHYCVMTLQWQYCEIIIIYVYLYKNYDCVE